MDYPKINYENLLYSTLSQEANLFINKKILAQVGLNLAAFLSFLIDKGRYHKTNDELTEDGYFFATNEDIHLFTGIPRTSITKLKKQGQELELFSIKKLENSFKSATHYKLNFEKLLTILSIDKSVLELAYERTLSESENKIEEFSESSLIKFSCRELRLLCKKSKIAYSGKDNKLDLINKILDKSIENKELNKWTEKLSTSGQKNCPLKISSQVDGKTVHQWTEKLSIGGRENCHKKKQSQKKQNQKNQIIDSLDIFENIFKNFNINFTRTNQTSVQKLLNKMSEREVILYLKETYENIKQTPNIKSIARLFSSKIAKGERQLIFDKEKNIKEFENKEENKKNDIIISLEEENNILKLIKKDSPTDYHFIKSLKNYNKEVYYNTIIAFKNKKKNINNGE